MDIGYCTLSLGSCYNDNGDWKCRKYTSGGSSGATALDGPNLRVLGGIFLAGLGGVNLL
jgi:hypothetical protein